jgi:hypothetical protein
VSCGVGWVLFEFVRLIYTKSVVRVWSENRHLRPPDLDDILSGITMPQETDTYLNRPRNSSSDWQPPQPPSDAKIWRYISLTQLLSIMEREKLWFTCASAFDDPYEGVRPKKNIISKINEAKEISSDEKDTEEFYKYLFSKPMEIGYVNCWNISPHESAALWKQYLEASQGVAITSTVRDIKQAFSTSRSLKYGKVKYIDYQSEKIPDGHTPPLYHKRKSFSHEDEFRISFIEPNLDKKGTYINIDLDILINEIYFPPVSQNWFFDLIKKVSETYDVDCTFKESEIDSSPDYSL